MWENFSDGRLGLALVLLFLMSMTFSCQELEYRVKGKRVEANVVETHVEKVQSSRSSYRSTYLKRVVGYSFMDRDLFRREYVEVPLDWTAPASGTVPVEYLPGWAMHSRLVGQSNRLWVFIFVGILVLLGLWVWNAARQE